MTHPHAAGTNGRANHFGFTGNSQCRQRSRPCSRSLNTGPRGGAYIRKELQKPVFQGPGHSLSPGAQGELRGAYPDAATAESQRETSPLGAERVAEAVPSTPTSCRWGNPGEGSCGSSCSRSPILFLVEAESKPPSFKPLRWGFFSQELLRCPPAPFRSPG